MRKYLEQIKVTKLHKKKYQNIVEAFERFHVQYDELGFWNQPQYKKWFNDTMEEYAFFVNLQPYSRDYIKRSRLIIQQVCSLLYDQLERDLDNIGQCIPVSKMLASILEKEGIWNYQVIGKVQIDFSSELNRPSIYPSMSPFDDGHAWVVAPPFGVIDLTIKHQHYPRGLSEYIPEVVMYEPKQWFEQDEEIGYFKLPTYWVMHNNNVEIMYEIGLVSCSTIELSNRHDVSYKLNGKSISEIYHGLIQPKVSF